MNVVDEFNDFLKEYKITGLAVAFVLGNAVNVLVQSLVNDIVMPLIAPLMANGGWKTATLTIGPFVFGWGSFLASSINFLIIAFVVFLIFGKLLKK